MFPNNTIQFAIPSLALSKSGFSGMFSALKIIRAPRCNDFP